MAFNSKPVFYRFVKGGTRLTHYLRRAGPFKKISAAVKRTDEKGVRPVESLTPFTNNQLNEEENAC